MQKQTLNITLLFIFCQFPVMAQFVPDTIHIPEVKIFRQEHLTEQLYSFSELDSFTLNQNRSINLSDLLNQYSTVYIKSTGRGTLSTASFRGTDPGHTKIYWNGLIINSPMLGQVDLSLIPSGFLDHVSLYHGGTSLVTGSGALGGIIALDNKPVWNSKNSFSISNELASYGTCQAFGNLELKKNNWISHSRAFFNHSENNYPFYNQNVLPNENQRLKNGQYSGYGYLQELYYRTRDNDLFSLKFWIQHADRNLPRPLSREGSEIREFQSDGNIRSVFSWKHYGRAGEVDISSGLISDRINYVLAESSDGYVNIDSHSRENSFINRINYSFQINPKTITRFQILYNYYDAGITEKIRSEGYNAVRSELSLMAGINRDIGRRLSTFFLLRANLIDKDLIPVMPSLGFALKLLNKKDLYLKTNLSRNYNIPGLNDLYWIPGGNPNLKPEESYTADLAIDLQLQNDLFVINSSLTGYLSRINDWIIWKPTQYQYWAPENVALVFSRGIEFSLKTITDLSDVKIIVQGNYNLCRTTEAHGSQLIYIPVHSINSYMGILFNGYQLNYNLGYTGRRYTQTDNEQENSETILEPYLLNDISVSKELILKKIEMNLNFSIRNLFDKEYQVVLARPMPGRNYSIILGLSF
jgi:outer membrane receptor protein involved in Fe transport